MEDTEGKNKIKLSEFCYIRGDHNEQYPIFATEKGIEIPDFYIVISWPDIEDVQQRIKWIRKG